MATSFGAIGLHSCRISYDTLYCLFLSITSFSPYLFYSLLCYVPVFVLLISTQALSPWSPFAFSLVIWPGSLPGLCSFITCSLFMFWHPWTLVTIIWLCSVHDIYCRSTHLRERDPSSSDSLCAFFFFLSKEFWVFPHPVCGLKGRLSCYVKISKPSEANCYFWLPAIQIELDWLIDWMINIKWIAATHNCINLQMCFCVCVWGQLIMTKDIPCCLCVAYVFGSIAKYQKST